MHVGNLGEVYSDFFRADGCPAAQTAWTSILTLPLALRLALRRDADDAFIQRVSVMKMAERIAVADARALALAERLNIPLVTTDHHAFDAVEQKGHFRVLWLPSTERRAVHSVRGEAGSAGCLPLAPRVDGRLCLH
jgi:hypothetical protein